jgi:hypothetical protein
MHWILFYGTHLVYKIANKKIMSLKDDVLHLLGFKEPGAESGLCITCANRPECIWVENIKLNCEHYE